MKLLFFLLITMGTATITRGQSADFTLAIKGETSDNIDSFFTNWNDHHKQALKETGGNHYCLVLVDVDSTCTLSNFELIQDPKHPLPPLLEQYIIKMIYQVDGKLQRVPVNGRPLDGSSLVSLYIFFSNTGSSFSYITDHMAYSTFELEKELSNPRLRKNNYLNKKEITLSF